VSHPELVVDLVGFLRQAEFSASQIGPNIVEVESSRAVDGSEAEREINLMLRIWRLLHPAVTVMHLT
jgi:hypothetical protein